MPLRNSELIDWEIKYNCKYYPSTNWNTELSQIVFSNGDILIIEPYMRKTSFVKLIDAFIRQKKLERILK